MTILFYDNANYNIPEDSRAALYFNGRYAAPSSVVRRYPCHFFISVLPGHPEVAEHARCLDVERWDASPGDALPFIVARAVAGKGRWSPATIYCSLDTVPEVAFRIGQHMPWRLWVAHWDNDTGRPKLPNLGHGELWAKQYRAGINGEPDVSVLYGQDF
jgi:hypothetical protein